jgi:hypothetical protein
VAVPERPGGWRTAVLPACGAAFALAAAATRPFTGPADLLTALPIALLALLVVVSWPLRPRPRPASSGPGKRHPYRAWVALLGAAVAWELVEYLARGSRGQHPTLSSMADALDRHYLLKALVFFGWLWLGLCIVRRGSRGRGRVPSAEPAEPADPA